MLTNSYISWASYTVEDGTDLSYDTSIAMSGNCSTTRGIFIIAADKAPYNVYADPFGNCANVLGVDPVGTLETNLQNVSYYSDSGVHGMAFDPTGNFLYAADDMGNTIWTYKVDETTGLLTYVSATAAPTSGANPRHAAVHPKGQYLYVILEESNRVAQYNINPTTHIPQFSNVTYSLIDAGKPFVPVMMHWPQSFAPFAHQNHTYPRSKLLSLLVRRSCCHP